MDNLGKPTVYRFGDYLLNTSERNLFRGDTPIEIPSKTFDVLHLLVENGGETVTKNEILDAVWGESFVEEGNLPVHISKLRKSLGATKTDPLIKTVTGRGYQLVVPVHAIKNQADEKRSPRAGESRELSLTPNFNPDSIAVLPLHNENGDEEIDYLADGITESLINSLSYMPDFRVLARDTVFRYKNIDVDAQGIGKVLGVATVLTGRLRVVNENLIIGAELINTFDGVQVWGTQINQPFSDIFEMQENLTLAISQSLKERVVIDAVKDSLPQEFISNTESYKDFLKGKYLLEKHTYESLSNAISYFEESLLNDPNNALALIGLAECNVWLYAYDCKPYESTLSLIQDSLQKAFQLNPRIPHLYNVKGRVALDLEWNMDKAEECFKKAISLNPNQVDARYGYSHFLIVCGRFNEAQKEMDQLFRLAPVSPLASRNAAQRLYCIGDYAAAKRKLEEILEIEPNDPMNLTLLGAVLIEMEKYEDAISQLEKSFDIGGHIENIAIIGCAYALSGNEENAFQKLEHIQSEKLNRYIPSTYQGMIYSALGDTEKAFECLEHAFNSHAADLVALKIDPRWAKLRKDKRFENLLSKIGLPIS